MDAEPAIVLADGAHAPIPPDDSDTQLGLVDSAALAGGRTAPLQPASSRLHLAASPSASPSSSLLRQAVMGEVVREARKHTRATTRSSTIEELSEYRSAAADEEEMAARATDGTGADDEENGEQQLRERHTAVHSPHDGAYHPHASSSLAVVESHLKECPPGAGSSWRRTPDDTADDEEAPTTHEKEAHSTEDVVYTHCGSSLLPGPPCVRNILGNELCERFSYYGLRAILVLFFHEQIGWSKDSAISMASYSSALAYFMPLLGGYLSDSLLGKYTTILSFSGVYVCGGTLLAVSAIHDTVWLSILGLVLIGIGTGGIKPCVSSFGADQFTSVHITSHEQLKRREHDISSFFHFFYFAINFGSVGSFIITPLMKEYCGYSWAFALPALLLAIAMVVFWSARREYYRGPIAGSVLSQLWTVFGVAIKQRRAQRTTTMTPLPSSPMSNGEFASTASAPPPVAASSSAPHSWLDLALVDPRVTPSQVENAKSLWRVLPIFAVLPVFWMLFDQQSSSWTLQADEMKLYGLQPEQIGVINPILIMILLPVFDRIIYPAIERCGVHFTPLRRMGVGMIISVFAFLLSAGVEYLISTGSPKSLSVFCQLPQIMLISIAEILISVTGLEFAYTQATAELKSIITAIFLITTAIGDLLTGVLYTALSKVMSSTDMYLLFAGLMAANFIAFICVSRRYTPVVVVDEKVRGIDEEEETEEERDAAADEDDAKKKMRRDREEMSRTSISADEQPGVELQPVGTRRVHMKRASTTSFLPDGAGGEDVV